MEARKLKNYFNADGAAFLLDSSLDDYHDEKINKKLMDSNDYGNNLFTFQKRIVIIGSYDYEFHTFHIIHVISNF